MTSFAQFNTLLNGEVAVLPATNASFNAYLGRCGAIVADSGGVLCHAALCAREAHIPAVVGCAHATAQINTGDTLEVCGDAGTVTILSSAAPEIIQVEATPLPPQQVAAVDLIGDPPRRF